MNRIQFETYRTTVSKPTRQVPSITYSTTSRGSYAGGGEGYSQNYEAKGGPRFTSVSQSNSASLDWSGLSAPGVSTSLTSNRTEGYTFTAFWDKNSYFSSSTSGGQNAWGMTYTIRVQRTTITQPSTSSYTEGGGRPYGTSGSGSTTDPIQVVTHYTTTSTSDSFFRPLSTVAANGTVEIFTTKDLGSNKTITEITIKSTTVVGVSYDWRTITFPTLTTHSTEGFITFNDLSQHQVVVADTVIKNFRRDREISFAALAAANQPIGMNELQYFLQDDYTSAWSEPEYIELNHTISVLTTMRDGRWREIRNATSSSMSESTTIHDVTETTESTTFLSIGTVSVEDWDTFTTTTATNSTTETVSSFSLNTGRSFSYAEQVDYDEDGNPIYSTITGVDHPSWPTYQTSSYSYARWIYGTKSTTTEITIWEDRSTATTTKSAGVDLTVYGPVSNLTPFNPIIGNFPWSSHVYYDRSVRRIASQSSLQETTTTTSVSLLRNGEFTSGHESGGATLYFNATYYKLSGSPNISVVGPESANSAFAISSAYNSIIIASPDFQWQTGNISSGSYYFSLQDAVHVIHEIPTAYINGSFLPAFLPSFTTHLTKNIWGYRAHPSAWVTLSVERQGANFFSSWTDVEGSTHEGTCSMVGEIWEPLPAFDAGSRIQGGYMPINRNITTFEMPGVLLTTTIGETWGSGFRTVNLNQAGFNQILADTKITCQLRLPLIVGNGFSYFGLADEGMP